MVIIPIFKEQSSRYTQKIKLDGQFYNLYTDWNSRDEHFYMRISDNNNNVIVHDIKLVANYFLLESLRYIQELPPGDFIMADLQNVKPKRYIEQTPISDVMLEGEFANQYVNCTQETDRVSGGEEGSYVKYDNVDFNYGYKDLIIRYAKGSTTATSIECRLDSPTGKLIATIPTSDTGGWDTFTEATGDLDFIEGLQTVYFVFRGASGSGDVDWFKLSDGIQKYEKLEETITDFTFDNFGTRYFLLYFTKDDIDSDFEDVSFGI